MAVLPEALRSGEGAPAGAAYRLREIRREGQRRVERRSWLDAKGMPLGSAVLAPDPPFDPRTRPWYRDPPSGAALSMSKLYVFFTLQVPGYTVSLPLAGKVHGVLAADILLSSLDDFLKAQRITPGARAVLIDDSGAVASAGGLSELLRKRGTKRQNVEIAPPHLDVLDYPPLEAAMAAWRGEPGAHEIVTVAGRTYIASIRPVASLAQGLHVVTIAPLDEFFGTIEKLRLRSLVYALAIAVFAALLALLMGRRVARKLASVAGEARKIREFELDPSPPITSRLIEIDQLGDAIARAKSAVRDFARYVPRSLVRQLIKSGATLELGGERRELAILFTDIVDFTKLSERADPAVLMRNASRYLAALSSAIAEHGGTIDKYIGNSIMAFWNAPMADPDPVVHACEAVLACREANRALDAVFVAGGWPAMRTRYGLHVGEVVVGNIGSEDRLNYTAVGAAVNLASRLESLNTHYGTEVLVSEAVVARAGDRFLFRRVDRVLPKGLAEPLTVYSLVGARPAQGAILDRAELWERILADWDRHDWTVALQEIATYLRSDPGDALARRYRERCIAFLRNPPARERDLVTSYLEK